MSFEEDYVLVTNANSFITNSSYSPYLLHASGKGPELAIPVPGLIGP